MSELSLFFHPVSQPSRSLLFLLNQFKIGYTPKFVDVAAGENKKDEYKKINPVGLIPAIVDHKFGDLHLAEAGAILVHLAETRNLESVYPKDAVLRARINQWMHWHHTGSRMATMKVFRQAVRMQDMAAAKEGAEAIKPILAHMDSALASSKFIAGDSLTIADMLIVTEIDQLAGLKLMDLSPYTHVTNWLQSMHQFEAYPPIYKTMVDIVAKLGSKAE